MSTISVTDPSSAPLGSILIVPLFDDDPLDDLAPHGTVPVARISQLITGGGVDREKYSCTVIFQEGAGSHVLLVAVKRRAAFDTLTLSRCVAAAARFSARRGLAHVAILDRGIVSPFEFGHAGVDGCIRGAYDPELRKTRNKRYTPVTSVTLMSYRDHNEIAAGARVGHIVADSTCLARDLVNLPANDVTPSFLADRAQELAKENGLRCNVLQEDGIQDAGMGALLGVAAGSDEPPRVISVSYGDPGATVKLALVGKGITFDSGGLSLKSADGMEHMKSDMAGAAAVIAGILAIARLELPSLHVTSYVGATENMPGGHAIRPGDVLTALSGETIEVLNTDAEGRLVLADLLTFAERQGATHIVDIATLTGGAVVALGHVATLVTGRPTAWVNSVVDASTGGLERMWPMPLFPEYRVLMESQLADIKNSGGRAATALTAAAFLGDFVDKADWAHMDIAGTSWLPAETPYLAAGATGAGVGTIVSLARALSAHGALS